MTMRVLRPLRRPVRRSPFVRLRITLLGLLAVLGPGVVSGFADNDAGGITTYSVVGAQFGYDLLWVVLASMLALYVTQEIGARLGLGIVLAPTLYRAAAPLAAWVETRRPRPSPAEPDDPNLRAVQGLRGHAVICGYGRVGRVIVDALRPHLPLLVVEQDPRVVRALRAQAWPGVTALVGDAANPVLLERMHLAQARLLVAAIPDALAVRAVVAYARRVNPTLDIVVRTHSQTEHEFLARYGVTESVLGELELAREMTRYALRHLHGDASEAPEVGGGRRDPRMGRGELRM